MSIHSTAIIGPEVQLGKNVSVGPYAVITGDVKIGAGTQIGSQVCVGSEFGKVVIGENNKILPGAMIGGAPQDLSFKGEKTQLHIGDRNVIREFTTLNVGTAKGGGITAIGSDCMLMAYVHVAHDCKIGNHVVMANSVQLAGHVEIGDYVRVGGVVGVVQFCRLGEYSYIGGYSCINKDILPYTIAEGHWALPRATNKIGLERAGFTKDEIESIHRSIRALLKGGAGIDETIQKIQNDSSILPKVSGKIIEFIKSSKAGIAR